MLTMMIVHAPAPVPPSLEGLRQASERWVRRERARARLSSGVVTLDELMGGGWPQGKVGELVGPASSGRSAVAAATVAAASARGEVTAWLDAADAFDPASAAAAGVDLDRLLWVRPRNAGETVRAAELVLETGGFTVVVLDLGAAVRAASGRERRGGLCGRPGWAGARPAPAFDGTRKGALRLRLARAVAVALVLAERPWVGTLAGATVVMERGEARWGGERGGPRWLEGLALKLQVERGRGRDRAGYGAHETTGGGEPYPHEEVSGRVSVGRALRACPEDAGGSAREHARSARSTETNEGSQTRTGEHDRATSHGSANVEAGLVPALLGQPQGPPSLLCQEREATSEREFISRERSGAGPPAARSA
jgi:hypothetical protein